ncbi:hypothetical protein STPYR_10775 [uncultured Stenotrophomonas sp.]|uniref:Uncharacterized protein n=1 Tax=uncultured Stenotrophomonas sp. TaxID=165438 RepID=A0A1Y5Q4Z6_9GAMM|nr:hypothetical protein STPYR_10775 [uncultured Stenotrophomonas sp.]
MLPPRRPAAHARRSRPVPPPQAVARRARWPAWAMSPRPARSPPGAASHPVLPLLGNAWQLPSAPAGAALLLTMARQPVEPGHPAGPPQARPLPAQPMRNPLGPSGCIAASNSPMPRPPPRTRCAAAMAAARAKAQACAIPIHKEN